MKKAINQFFVLGGLAFFAILTIGFVRNNFEIKLKKTVSDIQVITQDEASEDGDVIELSTSYDGYNETSAARVRKGGVKSYEAAEPRIAAKPKPVERKAVRINNFIDRFSEIAQEQALETGVPAGISLAVGIEKINSGTTISSSADFRRKVVKPLAKVKAKAPLDMQQAHFKYYANSERWAEGLENSMTLKNHLDNYALDVFDRNVQDQILAKKNSYVTVKKENKRTGEVSYKAISEAEPVAEESYEESYDRVVGHQVAMKIAEEEKKKNGYLTLEDLDRINAKTEKVLGPKLHFVGRGEPDPNSAAGDIAHKDGFQARGKLWEKMKKREKLKN